MELVPYGQIDHVSHRAWWEVTLLRTLYGLFNVEVKNFFCWLSNCIEITRPPLWTLVAALCLCNLDWPVKLLCYFSNIFSSHLKKTQNKAKNNHNKTKQLFPLPGGNAAVQPQAQAVWYIAASRAAAPVYWCQAKKTEADLHFFFFFYRPVQSWL